MPCQTCEARHHRGAVHDGETFFAGELQGRELQLLQHLRTRPHLACITHFALADQGGGDIRERREIAARAYRSFGRNPRQNAMEDELLETLEQHPRQHRVVVEKGASAAPVITDQMVRQLGNQRFRNFHRAGIAVAGVNAVDDSAGVEVFIEKRGATLDAPHERGIAVEHHAAAAIRHIDDIFDRDAGTTDRNRRLGHCGRRARRVRP